jgi:RNA polymerase sigma factor (sigma-70 family)
MDEDNIIRSAIAGNEQAFRLLLDKYQALVFAICLNILKDKAEAENAAQETFLQLYRSLYKYEYKGFKTYISRIAINKAIDLKRKLAQSEKIQLVSIEDIENIIPDKRQSLQETIIKKEENRKLKEALNNLPEKYREAVNYYYIEELSYEDIAKKQSVSIRTVETRLYRAKKILKDMWKEEV